MSKTLGLALGAGGAKGLAHVGFLSVLEENGIKPDYITGSSIGSMIGALYANGFPISEMVKYIDTLKQQDISDFDMLFYKNLGLMRGKKIKQLMIELLGEYTTFNDLKIPFSCVAVDLMSAKQVIFNSGILWSAVLASCSIPSGFQPVEMGEMMLVDGAILDRVPGELLANAYHPDVKIGIDILGNVEIGKAPTNIVECALRSYMIAEYQITKLKSHYLDIMVEINQPEVEIHKVSNLRISYERGRAAAEKYLPQIQSLLAN